MFFVLSKSIGLLANPLFLILACFFIAWWGRKKRYWRRAGLVAGIFLSLLFSNYFIANLAMEKWENEPIAFDAISEQYEVGIVLSGVVNLDKDLKDRLFFQKGADRVYHAALLYKKGKIKKILVSGGTGKLTKTKGERGESYYLKSFLIDYGIPEEDILEDSLSQNTFQNAIYSKKVLKTEYGSLPKSILITSAFHMKRSEACFKKAGFKKLSTFPTDYYSHDYAPFFKYIIPDPEAIFLWKILLKEWIGYTSYAVMGYL